MTDLDKICGILEGKVDLTKLEEFSHEIKQSPLLVERSEFQRLASMMIKKADREDVDELFKSLQTSKTDQEKRILTLEKEFD